MSEKRKYEVRGGEFGPQSISKLVELLCRCREVLAESEWTEIGVDVRAGEARHCPYCFQAEPAGHGDVHSGGFREPCPVPGLLDDLKEVLGE